MKIRFIDKTLLKFLFVGLFNTVIGCGVMFLLYNRAGCSYWISSAANYVIGGIVSFILNKYFTFQNKDWSWKQVFRFIINIVVCYLLAYGIAKPLMNIILTGVLLSIRENMAMLTGMCLFTLLNYFGQRFFAFQK